MKTSEKLQKLIHEVQGLHMDANWRIISMVKGDGEVILDEIKALEDKLEPWEWRCPGCGENSCEDCPI